MPQAESSSVNNGHLKSVVPVIPDAPVGHFRLSLFGGSKGYLVNTRDLCGGDIVAKIQYLAQNGKKLAQNPSIQTACGGSKSAKRAPSVGDPGRIETGEFPKAGAKRSRYSGIFSPNDAVSRSRPDFK